MNIVICGATSRIAECVARIYAVPKNQMLVVGRDDERLRTIASDLKVRGASEVKTLCLDLAQVENLKVVIEAAKSQFSKTDLVLVAFGILGEQKSDQGDMSGLVQVLNTNYVAPATLIAQFANVMEAQGSGRIAAITSVAGDRGRMSNYHYGSAKGALSIFLSGLRNRLHHKGVKVIDLKLGFVDTPMTAQFKKSLLWASPEYVGQKIVRAIEKGQGVAYIPGFWKCIMFIIRSIPSFIFNRLKL